MTGRFDISVIMVATLLSFAAIEVRSSPFTAEGFQNAGLKAAAVELSRGKPEENLLGPLVQYVYPEPPVDMVEGNARDSKVLGGAVYTHWGSSECTEGSEVVYSGTATGSGYNEVGGGANYLCMPSEPIYDEVESGLHADRGYLYSAEYFMANIPSRIYAVDDGTPTCAICRMPPGVMTSVMIPGRNECPSSAWRLEYRGYLMANRYTYQRTEFICMDRDLGVEPGTSGSQNGAEFFMVETRCLSGGGIPCNPYNSGYELTCAVCSI